MTEGINRAEKGLEKILKADANRYFNSHKKDEGGKLPMDELLATLKEDKDTRRVTCVVEKFLPLMVDYETRMYSLEEIYKKVKELKEKYLIPSREITPKNPIREFTKSVIRNLKQYKINVEMGGIKDIIKEDIDGYLYYRH